MPGKAWLDDIPYPFDHARHLAQANAAVRNVRLQSPDTLYHWQPEQQTQPSERPRRELALALALVQTLDTGDGGYEARIKACQKLYREGGRAPAEATRAAELLLRSRLVAGATDVETFWLAAAVAHPLRAILSPEVADLAWRYLVAAPFDLDALSAVQFARASRAHRFSERPRWPWELTTAMLERVDQRELCVTLLEAMVTVHMRTPSIDAAAARLPAPPRVSTPLFQDVVLRLAHLYIDAELDTLYARDVARQAALLGDERSKRFIESRVFDLPYPELARMVKAWIKGQDGDLDDYYRQALEAGQLQVARRLAEMELILRYGAYKKGPVYPSVEAVIREVLEREEALNDPRLEELILRTGLLYSRTHHYTPAAQMLVRHLSADAERQGPDGTLGAMAEELHAFMRACDPYQTLHEASKAMEERLEALDAETRQVLDETRQWLMGKVRLGGDMLGRAAHAASNPFAEDADLTPLVASLERTMAATHHASRRLIDVPATQREIATQAGVPWERLHEAPAYRLKGVASHYARVDRLTAAGAGALTGLLGGPWGAAVGVVSLVGLSARAVGRIGLCYGIEPDSPEGLELWMGSLLLGASSTAGEGLVTLLHVEAAAARAQMGLAGGLALAGLGPGFAPRMTARLTARVARVMGFSLSERRLLQFMPVVGAVLGAGADYLFLKAVTESAVHLGVRRFLMHGGPVAGELGRPGGQA